MSNGFKRCKVCSAIVQEEVSQCPECDSAMFHVAEIVASETDYTYNVVLEREIDVLPTQPGYKKYIDWQNKILEKTKAYQSFFDESSTSVTKYEEDGVAVTFGCIRISWVFPVEKGGKPSLQSFDLTHFLLFKLDKDLFGNCVFEHYLDDGQGDSN